MDMRADLPNRVLVVRAGALGDTLMVTPLIRALHNADAATEIDFLCSAAGAELLTSNPRLSRLITLRFRNLPYLLSLEKHALVRHIRSRRYTFAILLESAPQYRDLLQRAKVPEIRDFATHAFDPATHSIVNNLNVAGLRNADPDSLQMEFPVTATAMQSATEMLHGLPRPIIGIHPGYGPASKKKRKVNRLRAWTTENFAQVAAHLTARGASVVLTGSAQDVEACNAISRNVRTEHSRIAAGKTDIQTLGALIRSFDLLISVDSGPAHIAAAVCTPLVVLWGPGILAQTRPISACSPVSILQVAVPCAPCYGTPIMKTCERNVCMQFITPEEVIRAATALLNQPALTVLRS